MNLVNRVQKVLEAANIKLASVKSDVMGVSARAMLAAIVEGNSAPEIMAELALVNNDNLKPFTNTKIDAATTVVIETVINANWA